MFGLLNKNDISYLLPIPIQFYLLPFNREIFDFLQKQKWIRISHPYRIVTFSFFPKSRPVPLQTIIMTVFLIQKHDYIVKKCSFMLLFITASYIVLKTRQIPVLQYKKAGLYQIQKRFTFRFFMTGYGSVRYDMVRLEWKIRTTVVLAVVVELRRGL